MSSSASKTTTQRSPGSCCATKTRLVLRTSGNHLGSVYAAPTTTGHICIGALNLGISGCSSQMPDAAGFPWGSVDPGGPGKCTPTQVFGVVPNGVVRVVVVLHRKRHYAKLGENGFFFRDPNPNEKDAVPEIIFLFADGSSTRVY